MAESTIRIRDLPHYQVAAQELAKWLDGQGDESWWSVDGDPILMQRLNFPCPPGDLADELRQLSGDLLLLDPKDNSSAAGDSLAADQLDGIAHKADEQGDRVFALCWAQGPDVDWNLVEDKETGRRGMGVNTSEE